MRRPFPTDVLTLPALALAVAVAASSCQQQQHEGPVQPKAGSPGANLEGVPRVDGADGPSAVAENDPSAQMADSGVTARVKTALMADDQVKGLAIHVETHDAAVTLRGTLDTDEQVTRAVTVARGVAGVREVVNRLSVKGEDKAEKSNQG